MPAEKGFVKGKLTLYNFVSLRSPQLARNKEKDFRFIYLPDCKSNPADASVRIESNCCEKSRASHAAAFAEYQKGRSTESEHFERLVTFVEGRGCPDYPACPACEPNTRPGETLDQKRDEARNSCTLDCRPNEEEISHSLFTGRARFIAEHNHDIDYTYLEHLRSTFRNLSCETVSVLFGELIYRLNESRDFAGKEQISDWLVLWNLIRRFPELKCEVEGEKAAREAYDVKHCRNSFSEVGSKRKFRNEVAKKYIRQLLRATIVLPHIDHLRKRTSKDDLKQFEITLAGPARTNLAPFHSTQKNDFVPSLKFREKHEFDLATLRLRSFTTAEDNRLLLRNTLLENTSFSETKYIHAGALVEAASSNYSVGVIASIFSDDAAKTSPTNPDNHYFYISCSENIENGNVPYRAGIRIKQKGLAHNKFTLLTDVATAQPPLPSDPYVYPVSRSGNWYIKLNNFADIQPDVENFFIELQYSSGAIYSAVIQMNASLGAKRFEGSAPLYSGKVFPFTAKIAPFNEDGTAAWRLVLEGLDIPEIHTSSAKAEMEISIRDVYGIQSLTKVPVRNVLALTSGGVSLGNLVERLSAPCEVKVFISLQFESGQIYFTLPFSVMWNADNTSADGFFMLDSGYDGYGKTYAPMGFGINQLGVADYQRVVSHVVRYEAGEVAHIENLMGREYKEKVVTREKVTEITDFESVETGKEQLADGTSTERFQMQTEIAKILHEDSKSSIEAKASYNSPTTNASVNYGSATNTSRDESNRQAVTTAQELTKRAMERIVTKVRKERTVKVTDRLTDVSKHGFDNRGSSQPVSGVYRYINAIYKNEIENYGKRLAYEFTVPEPSRLHRLAIQGVDPSGSVEEIEMPLDPRSLFSWEELNEGNYTEFARRYDADVAVYPEKTKRITKVIPASDRNGTPNGFSKEIPVENGYRPSRYWIAMSYNVLGPNGRYPWELRYKIGNAEWVPSARKQIAFAPEHSFEVHSFDEELNMITNVIPVQFIFSNVAIVTLQLDFDFNLIEDGPLVGKWKKEVYKQICDAYEDRLNEYLEKLEAIRQQSKKSFETNPLAFRQIEQTILKMNCISYLLAPHGDLVNRNFGNELLFESKLSKPDSKPSFSNTRVRLSPALDEYTAFVKFIEQAFEWNILSYSFYPFYWAGSSAWKILYQDDSSDPLFKSFMQAGMARVVVTVRPGFEYAVLLYMITGKIWEGGHVPVYGDDLYLSIANELKEPEYIIDESWETVLPTNLLALQKGGAVINTHGLPNLEKPVIDTDNDTIEEKGSSLNPLIGKDEIVLQSNSRMGFVQMLRNLF